MVQIIQGPKSFGRSLAEGLGNTLPDAFSKLLSQVRESRDLEKENEALEAQGIDLRGIKNPRIRESLLAQHGKSGSKNAEAELQEKQAEAIGKYFGPQAAELYPHLTEGGKTKLFDFLLDDLQRTQDLNSSLRNFVVQNPQDIQIPEPEESGALFTGRQGQRVGRTAAERVKEQQEERKFKREHESKRSEKFLNEISEDRKTIPIQQANIDLIKDAIQDVGGIDQDFIAEALNFEPLRTAKGAQLKSAGKDLFLKTIAGTGTRPNQWIEQQIGSALTQIGKTSEANAVIAEIAQFQLDLKKKKIELAEEFEEKYENEDFIPGKIDREVYHELGKYAEHRQKEMAYDIRRIYETEQGIEKLSHVNKVPKGTPLTKEMARELLKRTKGNKKAAEQLAKKIGFEIPDEEIYNRK